MIRNIFPIFASSFGLFIVIIAFKPANDAIWYQIAISVVSVIVYLAFMLTSKQNRELIYQYILKNKKRNETTNN